MKIFLRKNIRLLITFCIIALGFVCFKNVPKGIANISIDNVDTTIVFLLIILGTFISEDITSITTGLFITQGTIGLVPGFVACFIGIYFGDLLLYLCGRFVGRPYLKRRPLRWFVKEGDIKKYQLWFKRRGAIVIFLSRFIPGSRLPTSLVSGILKTSFLTFAGYFLLALCIWLPIIIGGSMIFGQEILKYFKFYKSYLPLGLVSIVVLFLFINIMLTLLSYRGRRLFFGSFQRMVRWEFWVAWIFYIPVGFYVLYLCIKNKSLMLFTAGNPGITAGGIKGESKFDILGNFDVCKEFVAKGMLLKKDEESQTKVEKVFNFMKEYNLDYPIVLKPDKGERGEDVFIVKGEEELKEYLSKVLKDIIVQEYVYGKEFGIFYYRYPNADKGKIFSITEKKFPYVMGDGKSTLERLILQDKRAVCMARTYFKIHTSRLWDIPVKNEKVQLIDIGSHCRGAIFYDGKDFYTKRLEQQIDKISKNFKGFYFGRYDIRTPSLDDFKKGRNFKVLELNGVTSEATHIYDPKNSLWFAYKVLFKQWALLFDIAKQNNDKGHKISTLREVIKLLFNN